MICTEECMKVMQDMYRYMHEGDAGHAEECMKVM